jgi:exonuclease SbcC
VIPIRLALKDFLSYGSPEPIDFTSFDVACLSGPNGVGKSALLDAITWALFGCARGCEGGQNQDRLIRDGCTEAVVDFTFSLGGATYRIVRRRQRTPKGESKGEVRFLMSDGDEVWRNIAAETLKATDVKISSVLRMDYPTFTASAFFLQGRSEDLLARMRPDERKEVFARLLDLGRYEDLEEAARSRAREAERSRQDVAARIGELETASVDIAAVEGELRDANARLAHVDRDITNGERTLEDATRRLAEIDTQQALLERERDAVASASATLADARATVDAKRNALAEMDALLAREDEARAAVAALEQLRREDSAARAKQDEANELLRLASEIAATIETERRTLATRVAERHGRATDLERESEALEHASAEAERIGEELDATADPSDELTSVRQQLETHQVSAGRLEGEIRSLDEKIATTTDVLHVLAGGGGECPVCGHTLDAAHRAEAKRRLSADVRAAKSAQQSARAGVATERKEAKRLAEEIRRLEGVRRERERLTTTREGLRARLERFAPVREELDRLRTALAEDVAALEGDTFAVDMLARREDLERHARELYDQTAHGALLAQVRRLEPAAVLLGSIEEACRGRDRVLEELADAQRRGEDLGADIARHEETITQLEAVVAGRPTIEAEVDTAERCLAELRAVSRELTAVVAKLEARVETARAVARDLEAARTSERTLATEHRRYRRLAEAFGRGGIPDLIIDNALPELTDDANRILGRLTDHEMSVSFHLQKDTKSGKTKETFEALVHHDGGVRDYAMFSGGEAFRVAFAVRLAMSKLLVRRAGARLETLVIDEGFGTQDPEGRERLVEAINLARNEFAKILVITHLEDLKDQFGAQIVVSKTRNGSTLRLVGA